MRTLRAWAWASIALAGCDKPAGTAVPAEAAPAAVAPATAAVAPATAPVAPASAERTEPERERDAADATASPPAVAPVAVTVTLDTLDASNAEATLGPPSSKRTETWEMDGGKYTTWTWPGVELVTGEDGTAQIVTCEGKCKLATAQGLQLGSTAKQVRAIHGAGINRQLSGKLHIVVGDEYGGTSFDLRRDVVTRIVVGTWAE